MHDKTREVMLLAAYHIERTADSLKDCCTMDDGIAWDYEGDLHEYEQAMAIVSALRREAGVTEPAEPEPEVITPIGPEAEWYDPAEFVPELMCDVDVIWSSADGKHSVRGIAYRHPVGRWVAVDDDPDMTVEPTAWTPRPQLPKWVEDKL